MSDIKVFRDEMAALYRSIHRDNPAMARLLRDRHAAALMALKDELYGRETSTDRDSPFQASRGVVAARDGGSQ
jgi:hypothetical protein